MRKSASVWRLDLMLWTRRKSPLQSLEDVILVAKDVVLRPALPGDCKEWLDVRRRNKDYLKPYEPSWPADALTPEFFMRRISRLSRDWQEDRAYAFLIFHQGTGNLIGGININNVTRGAAQYATLGYWIDDALQGKGYMKQAGKEVLSFCFEKLLLGRINAACMPRNERSKNLLLGLDFTEEGFAKSYLQINGIREDHILFGLNADDFLRGARKT